VSLNEIDPRIIKRCREGERAAFEELYGEIKDGLFRWIFSLMRDFDEAEDVFQECTVRIFRHIGSLQEVTRFQHWLYRLVINQCNTHRSRKSRGRYIPLDESIEVKEEDYVFHTSIPENPRRALMRKELMQYINNHISHLPPKQRLAVLLFDVEGFSIKEVAEQMDCSEGAVKFNIHEARKKLRDSLGPLVIQLRKIGD